MVDGRGGGRGRAGSEGWLKSSFRFKDHRDLQGTQKLKLTVSFLTVCPFLPLWLGDREEGLKREIGAETCQLEAQGVTVIKIALS